MNDLKSVGGREKMEVWFINKERFEKVETNKVSKEWILEKMKELGMDKARVVVWHPTRADPDNWGVFEIKKQEVRQ